MNKNGVDLAIIPDSFAFVNRNAVDIHVCEEIDLHGFKIIGCAELNSIRPCDRFVQGVDFDVKMFVGNIITGSNRREHTPEGIGAGEDHGRGSLLCDQGREPKTLNSCNESKCSHGEKFFEKRSATGSC